MVSKAPIQFDSLIPGPHERPEGSATLDSGPTGAS
jgi:hypothetical protein